MYLKHVWILDCKYPGNFRGTISDERCIINNQPIKIGKFFITKKDCLDYIRSKGMDAVTMWHPVKAIIERE